MSAIKVYNTRTLRIVVILSIISWLPASAQNRLIIHPDSVSHIVSPTLFGFDCTTFYQDDLFLSNDRVTELVREGKFTLARYPGGEPSDTYLWKTNSFDTFDPAFGYENRVDNLTDFDEFSAWIEEADVLPIIVVNLEGAIIHQDIETWATYAADWVRYANIEKGMNIKRWEVGNESIYTGTRLNLQARQYAEAFRVYAQKMREVEPTIQVGAQAVSDLDFISFADHLNEEDLLQWRLMGHSERHMIESNKELQEPWKTVENPSKWWPTLLDLAGDEIDFITFHEYQGVGPPGNNGPLNIKFCNEIQAMKEFLHHNLPDKHIALAMTEYNYQLSKNNGSEVKPDYLFTIFCEFLMQVIEADIEVANIWPLSTTRPGDVKKNLLNYNSLNPQWRYYVLKELASLQKSSVLKHRQLSDGLKTLVVKAEDGRVHVVALNIDGHINEILVDLKTQDAKGILTKHLTIDNDWEVTLNKVCSARNKTVTLPPSSFSVISLVR